MDDPAVAFFGVVVSLSVAIAAFWIREGVKNRRKKKMREIEAEWSLVYSKKKMGEDPVAMRGWPVMDDGAGSEEKEGETDKVIR